MNTSYIIPAMAWAELLCDDTVWPENSCSHPIPDDPCNCNQCMTSSKHVRYYLPALAIKKLSTTDKQCQHVRKSDKHVSKVSINTVYVYVCVYILCIHVYTHIPVSLSIALPICTSLSVYISLYNIYIYIYMYTHTIYTYIYMYTHIMIISCHIVSYHTVQSCTTRYHYHYYIYT